MTDSSSEGQPLVWRLRMLVVVVIIGIPAMIFGLVGLFLPSEVTHVETVDYRQSGEFSYVATAPADSLYGPDGLASGEAIATDVVGPVTVGFDYALDTGATAELKGTIALQATVELAGGLKRVFPMQGKQAFTGAAVSASARFPADRIVDFVDSATETLGTNFGSTTAVTMQSVVKLRGHLSSRPLKTEFAPELRFLLVQGVLTLDTASAGPDAEPGADPLEPAETGKLEYDVRSPRTMSLLVAEPTSTEVRNVGLATGGLSLVVLLLLGSPMLRDREGANAAVRFQVLNAGRILPVTSLSLRDGAVADVSSLQALADLAKRYDSVIMHLTESGRDEFLVWDNGMTYRYRPSPVEPGTEDDPELDALSESDWQVLTEFTRHKEPHGG